MQHPFPDGAGRMVFTSGDHDAFGAYHDLYAPGSTILRQGDLFGATVTVRRFPDLLLFDRQVSGAIHQRDAGRVRRDDFDHYHLQVLRSGRMMGGAWGDERPLSPGDAVLFDTTRPQRTVVSAADYVTVVLPRAILDAALPDARRFHGTVLPGRVVKPLAEAVLDLSRTAAGGDADAPSGTARTVAGLLASVVGAEPGGVADHDHEAHATAAKRCRASAFIEAHLGRPDLDAASLAAAIGLSRSALYRLFAPTGGVEREILRRRLARLRVAMLRPDEVRTVAALAQALGFASESHCSRAFKAVYGMSPTHLRQEIRRDLGAGRGRFDPDRLLAWYGRFRPGLAGGASQDP